ncbi:hypothetical protein [Chroococcidiopsis sp.]|uniref:hypothetical protein n=1 Tax=Chroococcidiopsis sp. TaxID=3088168 RepID=UPI003F2F9012
MTEHCAVARVARLVAAQTLDPNFVVIRKFVSAKAQTPWETFDSMVADTHPNVVVVGYGEFRLMEFAPKANPDYIVSESIGGGSALVMHGQLHRSWSYRIPPMEFVQGEMVTLTFMRIDS